VYLTVSNKKNLFNVEKGQVNSNDDRTALSLVTWPAFIKLSGDDELTYLDSVTQWQSHHEDGVLCTEGDVLIDCFGKVFLLSYENNEVIISKASDTLCSLDEALDFVRQYAVYESYCCSAKIYADNFEQILAMIKSINTL
jgi:hypothetical protein